MAEPVAIKYRAFISYSHADSGWARWLHRGLESLRIDSDLVGRETATGKIPGALRPIFRDREDFTAGHSLNEQTLAALDASAALIVICSPASAKSRYVNEELRLFKKRHPERPVIPLIVGGKPGDPELECFPPALKFKLGPDGEVTGEPVEVLAADVREEGDGKHLALAKVVAGLLGVSSDDIFRRAERERRRQGRIRSTVAVVIAGLIAVGSFLAWQAHQQRQTISEVEALVAKYSLAAPGEAASGTQGLTEAITAIAEGAAGDARYAKALDLLKAGKPEEAEPLLKAVAEEKEARISHDRKQAADAYKNLGAITRLSDPRRAREAYAKAVALGADDFDALYWNGRLQFEAGNLEASEQAYKRLLTLTSDEGTKCATCWASFGLGDVAVERGQPSEALKYYRDGLAQAESFAKADPTTVESQRTLGAAYDRMGDALLREGKFTEALQYYRDNLANADRLVKADTFNPNDQRNLWVALNKLGDALAAQDNLAEALKTFQDGLASADRMAKADPNNAEWQRELGLSSQRVGIVLTSQGQLAEALQYYRDSLAHAGRAAQADPQNTYRQGELMAAYSNLGSLQLKSGMRDEGLKTYKDALEHTEKLAAADPNDAGRQAALAAAYIKVGDVLVTMGNLDGALKSFQDSLAVADRLATADPSNPERQSDVAFINDKIGDAQLKGGKANEALSNYQRSLSIRRQLAENDKSNTQAQSDEAASLSNIGNLNFNSGDNAGALLAYEEMTTIMRRLVAADESNVDWQGSLAIGLRGVGNARFGSQDSAGALAAYKESVDIYRRLAESNTGNVQSQAELAAGLYNLARIATGDEKDDAIKEAVKIIDRLDADGKLAADQKTWKHELLAMRDASKRGWLGLAVQTVPEAIAASLRLEDAKGALVAMVAPGSPAQRSGTEIGDVIISFDHVAVLDARSLSDLIAQTKVGQSLTIELVRDGTSHVLQVTLDQAQSPAESDIPAIDEASLSNDGHSGDVKNGSESEPLDQELSAALFAEHFKDLVEPTMDEAARK